MVEDQLFYVALKAVIEKDGQVLVLFDPDLDLDLPGGKIQVGETDFIKTLKREVLEETGLKITVQQPFTTGYIEFPAGINHRHAGKKFFSVFFKATYLEGVLKLSEEHDQYKWVNKKNYKEHARKQVKSNNIFNALREYFGEN